MLCVQRTSFVTWLPLPFELQEVIFMYNRKITNSIKIRRLRSILNIGPMTYNESNETYEKCVGKFYIFSWLSKFNERRFNFPVVLPYCSSKVILLV
jgi:hypothetical protein